MNNKKISDIYIPSKEETLELEQSGLSPKKPKFSFSFKFPKLRSFLLIPILILFIFGTFVYALNTKLTICLTPFQEEFLIEETIEIKKEISESNFENLVLPYQTLEVETTQSNQYQSTGNKVIEERATGIIRVFNSYSESAQVLVATTRFLSSDGKLFRTTERITIPGAKYVNGKLEPSYIEVNVIAAEPGEEYNIGASIFSIPGFAGTARYTGFYGKSINNMTGGSIKNTRNVSKNDIEKAKENLRDDIFVKGTEDLENKVPENFKIIPGSYNQEIMQDFSTTSEGEEVESFNITFKAKTKAFIISKELLSDLGKYIIANRISSDKDYNKHSLNISYKISDFGIQKEQFYLDLEIEGKSFNKINEDLLFSQIQAQRIEDLMGLLDNRNIYFEAIEFKKTPFWLKRVPLDRDKIELKIELD